MTVEAQSRIDYGVAYYTEAMELRDKFGLVLGLGLIVSADMWASLTYGLGSVVYFIRFLGFVVFLYSLFGYGRKFKRIRVWTEGGRKSMRILAVAVLLFLIVVEILIITHEKDDVIPASTRYVIVLGAGLHGETPSLTLEYRLVRARDYLQDHPDSIAVLCGGQGADETISEAEAMRRYLTLNGIAAERLWLEDQSTSTSQNIAFARQILEEKLRLNPNETLEVVIVSSDFHLYRAKLLAKRNNMIGYTISCPTPNINFLPEYYHFRECASVFFAYLGR